MKKFGTLLILLFISNYSFAQWTQVSSPTTENLNDVFFPSSQIGYAIGAKGTVLQTLNGGSLWSVTQADTTVDFNSVQFINDSVGYICGTSSLNGVGKFFKTTDSGSSWNLIFSDTGYMKTVYFINDSVGFCSSYLKLFKTTNAGNNWTQLNLNYSFHSIVFTNDSTGYFFSNGINQPVFKTTDTGQSFTQVYGGWYTTAFESSYFISDNTGYACAWYSAILEKTTDGGATWSKMDSAFVPECSDVFFVNGNTGYYVKRGSGMFTIRGTNNGGAAWTTQLSGTGTLNKFYFTDSLHAVAVGDNGKIYKTNNGGGVGIEKNTFDKIDYTVYPNPVANKLTVDINDQIHFPATIKIYSMLGEELFSLQTSFSQTTIDMEHFSKGLYFLKIITEDDLHSVREIIKY